MEIVKQDCKLFKERLCQTAKLCRFDTKIIIDNTFLHQNATKEMILNDLREGFKEAVNTGTTDYFIYYSGNGDKETGGWIVNLT